MQKGLFELTDFWTHVKEIPKTRLLVSLHSDYINGACMKVFDISKTGKVKTIYLSEEVLGSKNIYMNLIVYVLFKKMVVAIVGAICYQFYFSSRLIYLQITHKQTLNRDWAWRCDLQLKKKYPWSYPSQKNILSPL